ncbi:unnamed protein product [Adineta steineri]|uniref:Uncharacterized protein n=1 Tax=Adineta steineri TaxID=433720 RepID=A0A815GFZ5_9BILA|nr:unnamed protein product [Adineta steineri]
MSDIREFQIRWKRDLFLKNKLNNLTARYLIRKSIIIVQRRLCRQLNNLKNELQNVQYERQILKTSLMEHLQQRLQTLHNEIDNSNCQIKNRTKQEKQYWQQLTQTIEKRINLHRLIKTSSTNVDNKTFVIHADKNNENKPPSKIHKKIKYIS